MKEPSLVAIKERTLLTPSSSEKRTYHVVLDTTGTGLRYWPGDCVAIHPTNSPEQLEATLKHFDLDPLDPIIDRRRGDTLSLGKFLATRANLGALPEAPLRGQALADKLRPLLPRFYSIASSQAAVGHEIHLTVRLTGVCTQYLCETAPLHEPILPIYIQPGPHFALPDSTSAPLIMVGPGTGVAPYRSFLQERQVRGAQGPHWLFFGEWTRDGHFFYQEEWETFPNLRLTTAFSRDQSDKVYVQHRLQEHAEELWSWLEQGAYLYVCGDAKQMAPAVEKALIEIIERYRPEGRNYLKELRRLKRYRRDVY